MKKIYIIVKLLSLLLVFAISLFCFSLFAFADMLYEIGSEEFFSARDLIARVVDTLAPDASYAARLALSAVIVNRVRDPHFPSDIYSVVFERGEFEGVGREDLFTFCPSQLSMIAARDALLGFDVSRGALYFRRGYPSERMGACFYHDGFLFYK